MLAYLLMILTNNSTESVGTPQSTSCPHAGAGFSLDYDTQLDHFAVGLDALVRETFAGSSLKVPSLAVMPRIRYVF